MSVQPDVVLAACPVCGNGTVKMPHVQECVRRLKAVRDAADHLVDHQKEWEDKKTQKTADELLQGWTRLIRCINETMMANTR